MKRLHVVFHWYCKASEMRKWIPQGFQAEKRNEKTPTAWTTTLTEAERQLLSLKGHQSVSRSRLAAAATGYWFIAIVILWRESASESVFFGPRGSHLSSLCWILHFCPMKCCNICFSPPQRRATETGVCRRWNLSESLKRSREDGQSVKCPPGKWKIVPESGWRGDLL